MECGNGGKGGEQHNKWSPIDVQVLNCEPVNKYVTLPDKGELSLYMEIRKLITECKIMRLL